MKKLSSPKLAAALIFCLLAALILSALIPQEGTADPILYELWKRKHEGTARALEMLMLTQVRTSFWLILPAVLLFINILFFSIEKTRRLRKITLKHAGALVLHGSFLVILSGILVSAFFSIHGNFALTEGQSLSLSQKNIKTLSSGIFMKEVQADAVIKLSQFIENHEVNKTNTQASKIHVTENSDVKVREALVYPNHPLRLKNTTVYAGSSNGFSPLVYVKYKNITFKKYVRMANALAKNISVDQFALPPYAVNVTLKRALNKPHVLSVAISDKDGREIVHESLRIGEVKAKKDFEIGFLDIKRWTDFNISRDSGAPVVFSGFFMTLLGMVLRYVFQ